MKGDEKAIAALYKNCFSMPKIVSYLLSSPDRSCTHTSMAA